MLAVVAQGTGLNVYTHGEMLPAHSYPNLKTLGTGVETIHNYLGGVSGLFFGAKQKAPETKERKCSYKN